MAPALRVHDPLVWVGAAQHEARLRGPLPIAVLTACGVPPGLQVLQGRQGPPALPALEVAVARSKASQRSATVEATHEQVLRTLGRGGTKGA